MSFRGMAEDVFIILVIVFLSVFALAVPQLQIKVQDIGEGKPYVYYVPLAIYNNGTSPVYNYTAEITLTPNLVPAFRELRTNPFVTDLGFNPLYYWVMRDTSDVFTVFVKIPYIPPKNYTIILLWYGYNQNLFPSYDNPYKVFVYFDDYTNTSNVEPFYSGIFSSFQTPNYYTDGDLVENTTIQTTGTTSKEASVAETSTLYVNDSYIIGAGVEAEQGKDYPLFMFITYNYTINILWWTYNIPVWDLIAITNNTGDVNITIGSYGSGVQAVAPAKFGNWYYFRLYVSPTSSYANVQNFLSGQTVVGWTQLEASGYFANHYIHFGFGQAILSGTSTETARVKFIYVRRIVFPIPIVYVLPARFYASFS